MRYFVSLSDDTKFQMENLELIRQPLAELSFSEDFVTAAHRMGFNTLKDICDQDPGILVARPGFSYHWLGELVTFLGAHHLLGHLQNVPGNSAE